MGGTMKTKTLSLAAVLTAMMASAANAQNRFEDFDDGLAASRFTVVRGNDQDSNADFVFNYNVLGWDGLGIGNPNGWQTTNTGLQLWCNDNAPGVIAGINVYYNNLTRGGSTTMRFDAYYRFLEETVSTEYCLWGFHHSTQTGTFNSINTVALPSQIATSGYWCSASGDGGTTRDYRMMKVSTESQVAANYIGGSQNAQTAGAWEQVLPDLDGPATLNDPGQFGNRWVQVQVSFDANTGARTWQFKKTGDANWTTVFSDVDVTPFQDIGTFQIGLTDPFASQSMVDSYFIADNIEIVDRPSMVLARKLTLVEGTPFGGNLNSVHTVDSDSYFILNDESIPNAELHASGVSPITGATSYGVSATVSASRTDLTVFLDARNFSSNAWTNFAAGSSTLTNVLYSGTNTAAPTNFIDTTREVRARLRFIPQADLEAADGWSEAVDALTWDIQ